MRKKIKKFYILLETVTIKMWYRFDHIIVKLADFYNCAVISALPIWTNVLAFGGEKKEATYAKYLGVNGMFPTYSYVIFPFAELCRFIKMTL